MALGRMVKLGLGIAIVGVSLGVAAANSAALKDLYQEIFPTDPARRSALELCFLQDHKFNKLDTVQREACYAHALLPAGTAAAVNFVDLNRDAAQGTMPANDIRLRERRESPREP